MIYALFHSLKFGFLVLSVSTHLHVGGLAGLLQLALSEISHSLMGKE